MDIVDKVKDKKEHKKDKKIEVVKVPKKEAKACDTELDKARKAAKENHDKWLYLGAEFENFKKRLTKERIDLIKFGHERFAGELLNVVDSLESALAHVPKEESKKSGLAEGIHLTVKQFLGVFGQFGIKPIESKGKHFDPNFHEAIAQQESNEHEPGTVIQEHRKGYLLHDRLLRAAQVVVSKKKEKK